MFRRVLIANRGEIAARIARTCRRLGVVPVFAHSEADAGAAWLADAEATVCIGPAAAEGSYLHSDRLIEAACRTECQALHPGYGFLSENPAFAARLQASGIVFIGPPPSILRAMGDKSTAKRTMAAAGLPTVPGSAGLVRRPADALAEAETIGFPILLKATAGGGGKGMRRCDRPEELAEAFEEASAEASKAFGEGGLYLEKFLEGGRHVEFQIVGDHRGHAVCLGERECSVQRKHQKLIEESPAPGLDPATLAAMGERVAAAASAVGYRNAGTVEFLWTPEGELYFMEMNARLQVEHPVTEMRYPALDLVEAQLQVACGRALADEWPGGSPSGHAIEFRINAEDPDAGFRPSPGVVETLHIPTGPDGASVRWDSGLAAGSRVPPHYDSMIGKLIVHAADRPRALEAASEVLSGIEISGVATTIGLHRRILQHDEFREGRLDVRALDRWLAEG